MTMILPNEPTNPRTLAPLALVGATLSAVSLFASIFSGQWLGLTTAYFWAAVAAALMFVDHVPATRGRLRRDHLLLLVAGCVAVGLTPFAKSVLPAGIGALLNVSAGTVAWLLATSLERAPQPCDDANLVRPLGARTSWVG